MKENVAFDRYDSPVSYFSQAISIHKSHTNAVSPKNLTEQSGWFISKAQNAILQ